MLCLSDHVASRGWDEMGTCDGMGWDGMGWTSNDGQRKIFFHPALSWVFGGMWMFFQNPARATWWHFWMREC